MFNIALEAPVSNKVKQGVLSTKYPYVDALPSTGKIPISNHVLVTCVFASSQDYKYVADISP